MPIRLAAYTISGHTLTYSLQDVVEQDELLGRIPSFATVAGDVVTVDIAAMPPELDVLL